MKALFTFGQIIFLIVAVAVIYDVFWGSSQSCDRINCFVDNPAPVPED